MYFFSLICFRYKCQSAFRFYDIVTEQFFKNFSAHKLFHISYTYQRAFIYLRHGITVISANLCNLVFVRILSFGTSLDYFKSAPAFPLIYSFRLCIRIYIFCPF